LLSKLVFDVLQVVQLDFLVVDLLQQLVVLVLEALALLSQIVYMFVQIFDFVLKTENALFKIFDELPKDRCIEPRSL
jgi:hypothetical protein